ncbi:glycerol dehydrogenase [Noviherbaspirillum saxi]|uniref:Glycerol dehydrogenase n=1 Tax=Noviherbaspirillum saxi TaxID=2320863 RepID=A0A3A3FH33_9BURK|nr:glycerol dehydrogenase [Noviherbaspirillum saxi]RJF91708.1 glycerol dehydrogenase [Noviherbaspirillum saxi]
MPIFAATPRYVQGAEVLSSLGRHTAVLGERSVLVADGIVLELLAGKISTSFAEANMPLEILRFQGEVTHAEIASLAARAKASKADVIIGAGGGKALDAAKGVARTLNLRMVSVPTVASNDGPASASIAVYDANHVMVEVQQMKRHPDLVLVDTAVIASAPLRFFLAGIGDAISKKFEAEACAKAGALTLFGAPVSFTGIASANACYQLLRTHAKPAVDDVRQQRVSSHVEAVVEATVLLSTLSFENGGLSIAHAIARGFSHLPRAANTLHGEHVAYGLLVQLVLEQRDATLVEDLLAFYDDVGLPSRLVHFLRDQPTQEEISLLAEQSVLSPSAARFSPQVDAQLLCNAIISVEALSK